MASTIDTPSSPEHSTTDLEMADEIKKDQGFHECEVSTSTDTTQAEADLQQQLIYCKKNPGHKDFIPANSFNIEHIPTRYRDIDMFNLIKLMINLTVRICCRFTSERRPKTFPGTGQPYPFYNQRGKKCLKTGTGIVWEVVSFVTDEEKRKGRMEGKTCPCLTCQNSPTPMTQWYKVEVYTAQHVVFDSLEAQHTTCQLFYNSEEEKNKIQEFKGETTWNVDINFDMCEMICYIHDLELGKKLEEMWKVYDNLYGKLFDKFMNSVIEHPFFDEFMNSGIEHHPLFDKFKNSVIEHPLTVIVSHPHGCSKQVTIGELKHTEEVDDDWCRSIYTTQTCPGSSGATVYIVGVSRGLLYYYLPSHSQRCKENGLNMSVAW